ncbi:MAG: T9SS type A sorting domain-containing protein [bacterium]
MQWQITYPISPPYEAERVCKTDDGGFLIVGSEWPFQSPEINAYLLRIDGNGNTIWERTYGMGPSSGGRAVIPCEGETYIVAGFNSAGAGAEDFWVFKIDGLGDTLWSRAYGGSGNDQAYDVRMTLDGGFLITGWTESFGAGGRDVYAVRTDANGNHLWSATFGGSADDEGHSAQVLPDGSFAISGNTRSFGAGPRNYYLVRTGPEYPGVGYVTLISPGPPDWGYRLHCVSGALSRLVFTNFCSGTVGSVSGAAATAGWTATNYADSIVFASDTWLNSGSIDTFWLSHPYCSDYVTWTAGDSSGTIEGPLPVELTTFEAIAGDEQVTLRWRTESELDNSHFVLYKRKAGEEIFRKLTEIPGHGTTTEPHDYDYVDRFVQNGIAYEYQISDVDITGRETVHEQTVSATPTAATIPTEFALHALYPNPFNPTTTIRYDVKETGLVSLKVFDLLGREVASLVHGTIPAGSYSIEWNAGDLPSGVYLCRMEAERFVETRKVILLK